MVLGEAHEREHVGLRFIHQCGELRHVGAQLIGDLAPLRARGLGVVLDEGGANEGCDHAPALATGMGQHVAHEVHATFPPPRLGKGRSRLASRRGPVLGCGLHGGRMLMCTPRMPDWRRIVL